MGTPGLDIYLCLCFFFLFFDNTDSNYLKKKKKKESKSLEYHGHLKCSIYFRIPTENLTVLKEDYLI